MRVANTTSKKTRIRKKTARAEMETICWEAEKSPFSERKQKRKGCHMCSDARLHFSLYSVSTLTFYVFLKLRTLRKMQSISCLFFIMQNFDFIIRLPLHILTMEPGGNHCTCIDIISIISTLISFEKMHFSTY